MKYEDVLYYMHNACGINGNKCDYCDFFKMKYCRERYALETLIKYDIIKVENIDFRDED